MPVSYRIDAASLRISWLLEGDVTDRELIDTTRALRDDLHYAPQYDRLIDATWANSALVTGDALREIAADTSRDHVRRIALVGYRDDVYGMFRVFQAYPDDGVECEIFRERAEALRWLAAQHLRADPAAKTVVDSFA